MGIGRHLTEQQVSAWLIGERPSEVIQHMRSCSACQAEVLLLGTTLMDFRSSVREWTREHTTPAVIAPPLAIHRPLITFNRACLAVIAALACLLLSVSLHRHNPVPSSSPINADRVLMSQVDDEISRTVPTAMEPLLQLVAWQGDGHSAAAEPVGDTASSTNSRSGGAN
jgi:hypothetical protein